jgi:small subunit ribosomal protein S3Ae
LVTKKIKGKEWFTVFAPKQFGEIEIGKILSSNPDSLIGRRITVSAINLTDDFSKYYFKFTFRVSKVSENKAFTEFDGSECLRDYISRMVLRRVRRVDKVQDLVTKDNVKIRVKSLAIIYRRVKSSIQKNVREHVASMMKEMVENSTLEGFIKNMLSDEIKNKILQELRKIYPVRNFEIRKTEVLK